MRIAICDDLEQDRQKLKQVLYQLEKDQSIELDIIEYDNPEDLLKGYDLGLDYQILFLDVYMGNDLGTNLAKTLRDKGYKNSIIFCTSSEEHALEAFRVKADGYLVKPYTYQEFLASLYRLDDLFTTQTQKISFVADRIDYCIPVSDVIMIESSNKGCIVHTQQDSLFTWTKLKEFTQMIETDFFYHVGRSYFINLNSVEMVRDAKIILKNNMEVDIPKRDVTKIKQDINDYIWNSMRK